MNNTRTLLTVTSAITLAMTSLMGQLPSDGTPLAITNISVNGGSVMLGWKEDPLTKTPGVEYKLYSSTNLALGAVGWTEITDNVTRDTGTATVTVNGDPVKFFRLLEVMTEPPPEPRAAYVVWAEVITGWEENSNMADARQTVGIYFPEIPASSDEWLDYVGIISIQGPFPYDFHLVPYSIAGTNCARIVFDKPVNPGLARQRAYATTLTHFTDKDGNPVPMPAGDRGSVFIWIEGHVITANQGLVPDPARRNAVASYSAVYGHVATAGEAPIMAYIYENGGYDTVNGRGTEVARFNGFIDANGNIVPSSEIGVIPPGGSYVLSVHLIETSGVPRELGRDTFVTQPL